MSAPGISPAKFTMIYYTADLHFGHENVIRFDNRPFSSVEEMDEELIKRWNDKVKWSDTVYILGDVCMKTKNNAIHYISRLAGKKHLIIGNHDGVILKNKDARNMFESISHMDYFRDGDKYVCLCHYPIVEWRGYHHGGWHLYGHIHNNRQEAYEIMKHKERARNAGCMLTDYTPVTLDELMR